MHTLARESAIRLALIAALLAGACGGDDGDDFTPLVFAHGCPPPPLTSAEDSGIFSGDTQNAPGIVDFFAERGYPDSHLNRFLYDGPVCPPNREYAAQLGDYVAGVIAATGSERVDILGFSMGAVATRIYIKDGGADFVSHFVSMAGASHGSVLAGMVGEAGREDSDFPCYEGALEASPEYACDGDSPAMEDIQAYLNGCLTEDGRTVDEDETPFDIDEGGHIKYLSIWNEKDDLVIPQEAACLNQSFQNDCSDPVNHMVSVEAVTEIMPDLLSSHVETQLDPTVRQFVFDFLTAD
jgi:pimeloyl-ACP methyl ester carboxylesterase